MRDSNDTRTDQPTTALTIETTLRVMAFAALLVGAAIHAAVIDAHFREWAPEGVFFIGLGLVQAGLAVAVLLRPSRLVAWAIIDVGMAAAGLWAVTRTLGLPVGPEPGEVEAVGVADVLCTVTEIAAAGIALIWARRSGVRTATVLRRPVSARLAFVAFVAVGL